MSQTRKRSAAEAAIVTMIGMGYAVPINYLFIQLTFADPWTKAVLLTALFTVLSFFLKFFARRFFNWLDERHPSG